jgi:DNA modification methylase
MTLALHLGDCLDVLRTMPDASVDAVVTDPPYGLSFMGKRWDYDVPTVEVWAECLRVLKPGGHLLAFAGTRTQHRMAVRIEDAGFEIRDMIAWVYGSGFPKSLDVSKAIDRMDATEEQERRRLRFTAWVRGTGATSRQIDEATDTNMGGHYTTAASQPAIMTREHLEQCRHLLGNVPEWVEREADIRSVESQNMASREVVAERTMTQGGGSSLQIRTGELREVEANITAPATPEAQQWAGWGTALKPALEPITVARKPLEGTVAANVLAHGTGALNVDGCRVAHDENCRMMAPSQANISNPSDKHRQAGRREAVLELKPGGRWPANLIHDGSDEVVGLFPQSVRGAIPGTQKIGDKTTTDRDSNVSYASCGYQKISRYKEEVGSTARFFKQCKGYTEAWPNLTPEPANTAGNTSSPSRQFVAFALSDAATWALPVGNCNSLSLAPSMSATANELKQLSESVITAIQSIAPKFWQESKPAKLTLTLSHASFAVTREQTGITTITASHWKSDGSAEPVTFNITGTNTEAGERVSAPRAFYTAKASRDDREGGNTHPTVKPTDLMRYLCRLVTPPGGVVLDPFMGSGSTGKAAMLEGFGFIGIEREAAYHAIAERRIHQAGAAGHQPDLFSLTA